MPPTAADDASVAVNNPEGLEATSVSPDSISLPSNFLLALPNRPTTMTYVLYTTNTTSLHSYTQLTRTAINKRTITMMAQKR